MDIGFLGAGLMSAPMIENLLADGHSVRVWNRSAEKAQNVATKGATAVAEPADVLADGALLFSCLADDAALDSVMEDGSVLEQLGTDGVHVSMSTISATCAARHDKSHSAVNAHYVSAPILGRPDAVQARMQSYLIAGNAIACNRVEPILSALGAKVFSFGDDPRAACIAKINFNFLIASAVEAMSEAFAVVEKAGVDPRAFHEMITGTAFGCRIYEGYGAFVLDQAWDSPLFRLVLGLKDVRLANEMAADCNAEMRLGGLLEQRFSEAVANGLGEKDWTVIAAEVRRETGLDT